MKSYFLIFISDQVRFKCMSSYKQLYFTHDVGHHTESHATKKDAQQCIVNGDMNSANTCLPFNLTLIFVILLTLIALRKVKIVCNFDLSECNRVTGMEHLMSPKHKVLPSGDVCQVDFDKTLRWS